MILFSLGQMYSAVIIWAMSPSLNDYDMHWRGMLGLATLMPLLLFGLSYRYLLESPHWLLATQQYSSARDVVWEMATYKGHVRPEVMEGLTWGIRTPAPSSPEMRSKDPEEERACCSTAEQHELIEFLGGVC